MTRYGPISPRTIRRGESINPLDDPSRLSADLRVLTTPYFAAHVEQTGGQSKATRSFMAPESAITRTRS
jgi:hypothetical protein